MRVPGISPNAAGYAADQNFEAYLSERQHQQHPHSEHYTKTHALESTAIATKIAPLALEKCCSVLENQMKLSIINGNLDTGNNAQSSNGQQFLSADEFVRRALSSTSNVELNAIPSLEKARELKSCGDKERQQIPNLKANGGLENDDSISVNNLDESFDELNSDNNTYRSFKEAFNINRTFYGEYNNRHFENANDNYNHFSCEDVDPILIINSPCNAYDAIANQKTQKKPIETLNSYRVESDDEDLYDSQKNDVDLDVVNRNDNETHSISGSYTSHERTQSNNRERQQFVDEFHESSYRDYLASPTTSSSISGANTPKRTYSYFPRGIINPNYPGFQHLAHTLLDNFITTSAATSSDSYDSDMSDGYEMELSADSYEDLSEEAQTQLQLKLNRFNNNNNNNNSAYDDGRDEENNSNFQTIINPDEFLDVELRQPPYESRLCHDEELIASIQHDQEYADDSNLNTDSLGLPDNLQNALTLLEPPEEYKESISDKDIGACSDAQKYEECFRNPVAFEDPTRPQNGSTTPDILLKSNRYLQIETAPAKKENRPDLLNGVSPQHTARSEQQQQHKIENIKLALKSPDLTLINENQGGHHLKVYTSAHLSFGHRLNFLERSSGKDEMSQGVTPVDIIGDFGQEVEREFGLLVSGYRRLTDSSIEMHCGDDENKRGLSDGEEKLRITAYEITDAKLSGTADEINAKKYILKCQENEEGADDTKQSMDTKREESACDFIQDNAVDWSCESMKPVEIASTTIKHGRVESSEDIRKEDEEGSKKPKYQKPSYDERQLPPVAIEYKRCQSNSERSTRKSKQTEKAAKPSKKPSISNHFLRGGKRHINKGQSKSNERSIDAERKREEAELHQYQQLISDKEEILSNSRYTKLSAWAEYLKNSVKERGNKGTTSDLISPSALELFDAYKIGTEIDVETLEKHLKMAKEIEKKRRNDREEIRRRLAMGAEETSNSLFEGPTRKPSLQATLHNGLYFSRFNDIINSDTESHSSDSETCPKLSKIRQNNKAIDSFNATATATAKATATTENAKETTTTNLNSVTINKTNSNHPYRGKPLSVSCTNSNNSNINNNINNNNNKQHIHKQYQHNKSHYQQHQQQQKQQQFLPVTDEDKECEFFTKQARLQIEARMALAQAKDMAHMQMEMERQNRCVSPITAIIRSSLEKIGVRIAVDKRRVSRQMLTDMNIAQLQILVNSLHTHIEELNETLVKHLLERDQDHQDQDSMLVDIEELTRYIGTREHLTHQHKHNNNNNNNIKGN